MSNMPPNDLEQVGSYLEQVMEASMEAQLAAGRSSKGPRSTPTGPSPSTKSPSKKG